MTRNERALICALMYPIIFERDPIDGVDRVLDVTIARRALDAGPDDYAAAIASGLASTEELAALLPQPHGEPAIRAFLAEVARRL